MLKLISSLFVALLCIGASSASAATIVSFEGNSTDSLATATVSIELSGSTVTGSITNTSPHAALLTAFGFNVGPGNLNGFTGNPATITDPGDVMFTFDDDDLGTVPQFNQLGVALDFGYVTGTDFAGGQPQAGLAPGETLNFSVAGNFGGLTEDDIAAALFLRYQQVGLGGGGSDVAVATPGVPTPNVSAVPEPASMVLLGSGLAYLAQRRRRTKK